MTPKLRMAFAAVFMTCSASGAALASEKLQQPYSLQQLAANGWSVIEYLGQEEGQERIAVRDATGRRRVAILHTNLGLLTLEPLRHPAER